MINFRSLAIIATTMVCLTACNSGDKEEKVGTQVTDSTAADSTTVDSMANGTGGGMPRDIPNGTGTEPNGADTSSSKQDTTRKAKWPSQSNNP